jgi:hypothetical protein
LSVITFDHVKPIGESIMFRTIKALTIAVLVAGSASSAFAASVPQQDRTSWFLDSGRTINGQQPSEPYYAHQARTQGLIEGRNSAVVGGFSTNGTSTDRNALVDQLGN